MATGMAASAWARAAGWTDRETERLTALIDSDPGQAGHG
jgi:hypothetical protein